MSSLRGLARKVVRWSIENLEEVVEEFGGMGTLSIPLSEPDLEEDLSWHGPLPSVDDVREVIDDRAYSEQFSSEDEASRWKRKAEEYFDVIQRIEKERDELWSMYRQQVAEHLNAQTMLLKERVRLRQQVGRAVGMLNKMRAEKGLDIVKKPADLDVFDSEVDKLAEQYIDKMVRLSKTARSRLDEAKPKFTKGAELL